MDGSCAFISAQYRGFKTRGVRRPDYTMFGCILDPNLVQALRSRHVHTEESLGSLDASNPAVNSVFDTRNVTGGQGIFRREIQGIVGKKLETTTACWGLYAVILEFEHRGRG